MAMQSLGRAIHYLQDIGCTPHSSGLTSGISKHSPYENYLYADKVRILEEIGFTVKTKLINGYVQVTESTAKDNRSVYGQYNFDNNIGLICNELASLTCVYEDDVQDENYDISAKNNIKLTVSYIAGLLNRFYEDVNFKSSCHEIKSGSTYLIKNVQTGKYLDTSINPNMTIQKFNGSLHQQFKIEHDNSSGAFQISSVAYPNEKLSVTYGLKTEVIHSSTDRERFKIANEGNGHFRIASRIHVDHHDKYGSTDPRYQYTNYLTVVSYQLSYYLKFWQSDPTDPYILWDFIEVVEDLNYSAFNLSETEQKVFYYMPSTTSGIQTYTTISNNSTNISINDCTSSTKVNRSQSINYNFISGQKYLISISFQSQNAVGEVIFSKASNILVYEDQLMLAKSNNTDLIVERISLLMAAGEHKIITYTPTVNDNYKIQKWCNENVTMQIYEKSFSNFNRIDNINGYNDYKIIKQLTTNTYYIHLYIEDEKIGDDVDLSILRPEFQVTESENWVSLNKETKYLKFEPSETEYYSIYTSKSVALRVYDSSYNPLMYNYANTANYKNKIYKLYHGYTYYISVWSYGIVDFSLFITKPELLKYPLPKDLSLMPSKTEIYKIDFSNTGLMMFYSKNKNVTLELYEYDAPELVFLCNNKKNLNIPLKQYIDDKIYYLFVTSNVTQSNELFISYNVHSGLSDIQTIFEKNANNQPIIYHESISTYGKYKFYKFTPLVTGNYTFSTKTPNNGNTYMELYDNNGNLIAVDDDSGDTWSAKIHCDLTKGVNYYISVRYKHYDSIGQYDLQVYKNTTYIWKVIWSQIQKSYAEMGDFTIIKNFDIWSLGVLDSVDSINKILTFSSITWSWSVENPYYEYLYQSIGMIIGKDYFGEKIDPNTGYTSYNYLLIEGDGKLEVTTNTWFYQCTYYDVSIKFSDEEWEYYCNAGIIKFEPL